MRASRVERGGRGEVRGFFLFIVMLACACEKTPPPAATPDVAAVRVDQGSNDAADAGAASDAVAEVPPTPLPFDPPWTELAPAWAEVSKTLSDTPIGKMSGEAWGTDVPVHGIVRAQCGSGALLQAIFKTDKGLLVSPAMPVRFFGLPTSGKPIVYKEGGFMVTTQFTEDTPDRIAGSFKITYDEHGQEKTFIDLSVDGKPMGMLFEPKLDGNANVPEFQSCHPSGRFYAKTSDGRTAEGFLYAAVSGDGRGMVLTPHLSAQTGLRIVVFSLRPLTEPWTLDLSKETDSGPVRAIVDAVYTPELTVPGEAEGQNIGSEQTLRVRSGTVEMVWPRKGKEAEVSLRFTDLRIPELIEGPLRGTTFTEFRIEAVGVGEGVYPAPPVAEPLSAAAKE